MLGFAVGLGLLDAISVRLSVGVADAPSSCWCFWCEDAGSCHYPFVSHLTTLIGHFFGYCISFLLFSVLISAFARFSVYLYARCSVILD